jgi:hypothetical protein
MFFRVPITFIAWPDGEGLNEKPSVMESRPAEEVLYNVRGRKGI